MPLPFARAFFRDYDVLADGPRFVVVLPEGAGNGQFRSRIDVVLNWQEELKQRVPAR